MTLFSVAYWKKTLEAAVVAGFAAFSASLSASGGVPTLHDLETGAIAAGIAVVYVFVKAFGGSQAVAEARATKAPSVPSR